MRSAREVWRRHGIRSVINIAPGEEELGEAVLSNALPAQPVVYCAALPELVALMAEALVAVGGDTGPLHLAAAVGTHVVALFGPTNPGRNGPLPGGVVIQNYSAEPRNYQRGDYERGRAYSSEMLSISVDQVLGSRRARDGQSFAGAFAAIARRRCTPTDLRDAIRPAQADLNRSRERGGPCLEPMRSPASREIPRIQARS